MKRLAVKIAGMGRQMETAMAEIVVDCAERTAEEARSMAPVDSGALRMGIGAVQSERLGAAVVSAAPHGAMVEYGTSRMAPRPYMLPAAEAARGVYFEAAHSAVREVLK